MGLRSGNHNPIVIYNEPTLADCVLKRLYARQNTYLSLNSSEEGPEGSRETATVSIITTAMAVHKWLSVYGNGVFRDITGLTSKSPPGAQSLQIAISRVGSVTGDIKIQFSGNTDKITETILVFLQKTHSTTYSIVTLVDRHTALSAPEGLPLTQIKCSKFPYGLLPGYLLTMSAASAEEVVHFCSVLTKPGSSVDTFMGSTQFNSPHKSTLSEYKGGIAPRPLGQRKNKGKHRKENSTRNKGVIVSTGGTSSPPQERRTDMTMKLLEFTRQEVTYLIGRNGIKINALRQDTGATIRIVPISNADSTCEELECKSKPRNSKLKQYIRLSGPKSQVHDALALIEADIYQFRMGEGQRY